MRVGQRTGLQQLFPDGLRNVRTRGPDHQLHGPGVGELHRVGQQVPQHLEEPLLVGVQRRRQLRRDPHGQVQALLRGQRPERRLHVVHELDERDTRRGDVHLARLDLRQVEDVVDQLEQVGAGTVDRLGELDLLRREIALGVVGEQLGQDQQRVERRTQLVRHVGEKLALVAHGHRELLGALLQDLPRLLDLGVLHLDVAVLPRQQLGLLLQFGVGGLQRLLPVLQLGRTLPQLLGQLLRLLQQLLGLGVHRDGVDAGRDHLGDLVEEVLLDLRERREGGQLDHAEHLALEEHRQHDHLRGRSLAEPGGDLQIATGRVLHQDRALLLGGRADQPLTRPERRRHRPHRVAVRAGHAQLVLVLGVAAELLALHEGHRHEERAVLRGDHRRQFAHDQRGDVLQVPASLHQRGDAGEVALEPVLLLVGDRGVAQVGDHLVDVVLQFLDLAGRVDVDLQVQVAAGHRGRHARDGTHLPGQVPGHLVHRLGQVPPGAVDVTHACLTAELPLGTHLSGHPGDLLGEAGQLVDHRVDRRLQLEDLAARVNVDLLRQVTLGDGRGDHGDVAHLPGQVRRHLVHRFGEVLPGAGHTGYVRLAAQNAVRTHLTGHLGDLVGERTQRLHHGVDGVGELRDLAARLDGHLPGQVTVGDRRGHLGDVAHLHGQVVGHQVDVVAQVLPDARDARHVCLAAQNALGAHLTGHPGHLLGKAGQLVDHGVDRRDELEDLALRVNGDLLGQVALGDRGRDLGDVAHLDGQVVRHEVHGLREVLPGAGDTLDLGLAAQHALRAHLTRHARDLLGEGRQLVDHRVQSVLQLQDLPARVHGDLLGEVTAGHGRGHLGDVAHLGREVSRHAVHRVGEVPPHTGDARNLRLTAQAPLGTHVPGDPGHLVGEGGELVHHRVDGVLQLQDLPARVDVDLLREVTARHGRRHLGDLPHLGREVAGHEVDGVRQLLPRTRHTVHTGLTAQPALRAHVPGHPRDLVGEARQLVHHRVHGVLQLEHLAGDVDGDLLGEVAVGHRRGHLGDVAHLTGQVAEGGVDGVRQVLPGTRRARHLRLAAQLTLDTDLPRDPGHLGTERRQLVHHAVDGVLQLQHLAGHVHGDLLRQITAGHGGRHRGDVPHLRRQVPEHRVDGVRQVLPGTRRARHVRLTAEPPLGADLVGHARDLVREDPQRLGHLVDRLGELCDLATRRHGDLLRQVTVGDGRRHLGDPAHLCGQVARHGVDGVGQLLPHTGHTGHLRLPAQDALGAHLTGDPGHLRGEGRQLLHHRVDGVLQLQHLAGDVHGDLAGQITPGDRRRHQGDVAHLCGQPVRHRVDGLREVLPRTRHAPHPGLATQLALGADLAGHARDLVGERRQLVDQVVDGTADLQELAPQRVPRAVRRLCAQIHARREIALRDRRQHPADLGHGPDEIVDQGVGVVDGGRPGALAGARLQPFREFSLTPHHAPYPRQLTGQVHVPVGHLVEDGRDLGHHAVAGHREPLAEVAVPHRHEGRQQPVKGSRVDGGGPSTPAQGRSAFRARLRPPRRCARLHCVPPEGVDRYCRARPHRPGVPVPRPTGHFRVPITARYFCQTRSGHTRGCCPPYTEHTQSGRTFIRSLPSVSPRPNQAITVRQLRTSSAHPGGVITGDRHPLGRRR